MPWVVRDVVNDINKAVGRRWHSLDPLLPEPGDLPEGCMAPLVVDSLEQTWSPANQYVLSVRLRGPDLLGAADELLDRWREHLAGMRNRVGRAVRRGDRPPGYRGADPPRHDGQPGPAVALDLASAAGRTAGGLVVVSDRPSVEPLPSAEFGGLA